MFARPATAAVFLSTPSARRATLARRRSAADDDISIHALREEGDPSGLLDIFIGQYFYPRPPRGGRPGAWVSTGGVYRISIHALREEGDYYGNTTTPSCQDFYPRPPRGGRHCCFCVLHLLMQFLSTPSARRATALVRRRGRSVADFYPRPPRGGRLSCVRGSLEKIGYFYPRPPRGGRRHWHIGHRRTRQFLSTPSARRATLGVVNDFAELPFLSTPSARRATIVPASHK